MLYENGTDLSYTYLPMVLMPLTPRFKHASLSLSIGVDIVSSTEQKRRHNVSALQ